MVLSNVLAASSTSSASDAAIAGLIVGGTLTFVLLASLVFYILLIIAYWKIFTKAGEKGWKSIIPFYNVYIQFKISWNTKFFWIAMLLLIAGSIITFTLGGKYVGTGASAQFVTTNAVFAFIGAILMLAGTVIILTDEYWLSKSFGHGWGYFIGLLFLPNIFTLILGFGKSRYIGNCGANKNLMQS